MSQPHTHNRAAPRHIAWPWRYVAVAAGLCYSLWLVSFVPSDTFFSCDGAVKFLYTSQLARGGDGLQMALRLPGPAWAHTLWNAGFVPYQAPFVQPVGNQHFVEYPPFFSWLTAPLYRTFDIAGLYALPMLAVWLIWISAARVLGRLRISGAVAVTTLVILIFGTPITFYAATYWEHTPALLLSLPATVWLLTTRRSESVRAASVCGVMLGLSSWLRPEHMAFTMITVVALWIVRPRHVSRRAMTLFTISAVATLGAFLVWNRTFTGVWLGFQGMQATVPGGRGLSAILSCVRDNGRDLLLVFAPVMFLPGLIWRSGERIRQHCGWLAALRSPAVAIVLTAIGMFFAMPILFANTGGMQWGPRYLLPVFAPLTLCIGLLLRRACRVPTAMGAMRRAQLIALLLAALFSIQYNTRIGSSQLIENYTTRIQPAAYELRRRDSGAIVAHGPFAAMELLGLLPEHPVFCVNMTDANRLGDLMRTLAENGVVRVTLVLPPDMKLNSTGNVRLEESRIYATVRLQDAVLIPS